MTRRFSGLILTATLLVPVSATAELPLPNPAAIREYRGGVVKSPDTRGDPIDAWETALVAALATMPPDHAAAALAPRFDLTETQMRELVRLWLFAATETPGLDAGKAQTAELRKRLIALVAATHRAPLALEVAASILSGDFECDDTAFAPLLAGTTDPAVDAWRIAHAGRDCAALIARFAAVAPDRAMPALLAVATNDDWLPADARLALLSYIISPAGLARIDAPHRDGVRLYFTHGYLVALLKAGLGERATALFDSLPPAERDALIARRVGDIHAEADGLPIALTDYTVHVEGDTQALRTGLAAAYALAGRTADAEALLATLRAASIARDCEELIDLNGHTRPCPPAASGTAEGAADTALLEQLLIHPNDDPYPIAENYYGSGHGTVTDGVMAELACKVFAEPGYQSLCAKARDITRGSIEGDYLSRDARDTAEAIIAAAHIPGDAEARQAFAAALAPVVARGASMLAWSGRADQPAIDPVPPPFAEHPIPLAERGIAEASAWPKIFARLPDGYQPVRIARDGQRVAVISVSQNYDPTGEVSRGGYWVHLSDDGGKSWQRPLYTGLAEHFPYDVVSDAKLPLFDGDTLNIAVAVRLLDTRSISYPPVALRIRRRTDNLYLAVPIADLTRDSDGDGLTDLAARHLLLAPDPAGTAYVVGHDDDLCTPEAAATAAPRVSMLTRIFGTHTGALIEPADRKPGALLAGILSGQRDPTSADRPILVSGTPADYACLHPDRLMIVYDQAQLARLRRMTPDFHAVDLPPIIFNRARTRGYAVWSTGWSGGTTRLTREAGGGWKLEEISSWIS